MAAGRKALVVATYQYADDGLRQLAAPEHDAEDFAAVLEDPAIADFDVTMLVNQPHYVVGEAIADFYGDCRRDDLTLLYFSGHGLKDDEGRLHLAMTNTRREALLFTAISAAQLNEAMDACASRRKVLVLDCCYSGAFPAGRTAKSDEGVQTLERFQGKGRAVLTASDATQYAFEGDDLSGSGTSSVFTRYLVEAIRSGEADLDEDGDIALDELYSYVREKVVAEVPQQRPKKQEDVDGRILIARNVHWTLPDHLRHAIESPISAQRLTAVDGLAHLHRVGNDLVRSAVAGELRTLAADDSRSVSAAATALLGRLGRPARAVPPVPVVPTPRSSGEVAVAAPPKEPPLEPPRPDPSPPDASPSDALPAAAAAEVRSPAQAASVLTAAVLSLLLVSGALLLVSRLVVFEAANGYHVVDIGYATATWVLGVVVPLVAASQLLIARAGVPWAIASVVGLVTGTLLTQVDQVLVTTSFFVDTDTAYRPGPGWWLALLGTVLLMACVVLLVRRPRFREWNGVQRNWRAALGAVVLVGALMAWLSAFRDFYLWFPANGTAFLMAAVALPVAVLALNGAQRLAALVAVTVFGVWLAVSTVRELVVGTYWSEPDRAVTVIASALVSVAACYLAQARLARPVGHDATGTAPRR